MGLVMGIPVRAWKYCTWFQIALLRHVSLFDTITAAARLCLFCQQQSIPKQNGDGYKIGIGHINIYDYAM